MKTRYELGIPMGWHITREEIQRWDVIEVVPGLELKNRRYVVEGTDFGVIRIRLEYGITDLSLNDERIIWVIRWYPSDDEFTIGEEIWPLRIDVPDDEWEVSPVFTDEMIEDYSGVETLLFTVHNDSINEMDKIRLHNMGFSWNKRWIIWDTLKFYTFENVLSYFI